MARPAFFCADPVLAGLHSQVLDMDGERSARTTPHHIAHWAVERPAAERRNTIAAPRVLNPFEVVHEVAHSVDYTLLGRGIDWRPCVDVTEYAETNAEEAFAEAFTAWFWRPHDRGPCFGGWTRQAEAERYTAARDILFAGDPETVAFFRELEDG